MSNAILFVYGTLKRGERNHHFLAGQTFLGPAITAPRYRLYDLGTHPGMIRDDVAGLTVQGELWEVEPDALAAMDAFEEIPGPFVRVPIEVPGATGVVEAYCYNLPIDESMQSGSHWPF